MELTEFKEYKYVSFWREDNDIIGFKYAPGLEMDTGVAEEIVSSRLEYCKGKSMYCLIELSNLKSVTKEAREFMSDPEKGLKAILAGGFISNKAVSTMVINFFLMINKPSVPAKFFTDKDDALSWLKKIKKEKEHLV